MQSSAASHLQWHPEVLMLAEIMGEGRQEISEPRSAMDAILFTRDYPPGFVAWHNLS